MGLNLTALAALANQNANPATKPQSQTVHNAPSQPTSIPSATSILQSLAKVGTGKGNSKEEEAKIVQMDQSRTVPTGIPLDPKQIKYQEISDKILELKTAIHSAHPRMPGLLQEIWATVHSYPEQVTLLEEDQMEIIISGLEKVVDTDLAQITLKSATSGKGKSKAAISNDSLGF